MTRIVQRPGWVRLAVIFSVTFLGCLIALGLLLLAWTYAYYETGGGLMVHLNFVVVGSAIIAAAVAAAMTISRGAEK